MKDLFWKLTSLVLMMVLIVVVASQASGTHVPDDEVGLEQLGQAQDKGIVFVEADKQRYLISGIGSKPTENDKIILWDSWDVANTGDIWFLKDPHTARSKWTKMSIEKK